MQAVIFAALTATVFGLWTVFHQRASAHINSVFGALVVSATAVIVALTFLLPRIQVTTLYSNPKGILFAALAGVTAFGIDYFALRAYSAGGQISIVGPIIIAGSIAVATVIGFFLGEAISPMKILALLMIIIGSALLATLSQK